MADSHRRRSYWQANICLILTLLAIWGLVSVVFGILLVDQLNAIQFFGIPLGFWVAQQGSILTFVALIFVYAVQMDKLDRRYRNRTMAEQQSSPIHPSEIHPQSNNPQPNMRGDHAS